MKIKMNNKLSFAEADKLIEKYYEGLTTGEEEKQLGDFLSKPNLPKQYEAEQAIFGYFDQKIQKTHFSIKPLIGSLSTIAAIVLVVIGLQFIAVGNPSNYAYIDGKKITNLKLVKKLAKDSMKEISDETGNSDLRFDSKELILQQLGTFSE